MCFKITKILFFLFSSLIISFVTIFIVFEPEYFNSINNENDVFLIMKDIVRIIMDFKSGKQAIFFVLLISAVLIGLNQMVDSVKDDNFIFSSDQEQNYILGRASVYTVIQGDDKRKIHIAKEKFHKGVKCLKLFDIDGAMQLFVESNELSPSPNTYLNIGFISQIKGDYNYASKCFISGINMPSFDRHSKYLLFLNYGTVLMSLSNYIESEKALSSALSIAQSPMERACAEHNIGLNLKLKGKYSEAISYIRNSENLFYRQHAWVFLLRSRLVLSDIFADIGQLAKSEEMLKDAQSYGLISKDPYSVNEASISHIRSRVYLDNGRLQSSVQNAGFARSIFKARGYMREYILSSINLAEGYRLLGQLSKAELINQEIGRLDISRQEGVENAFITMSQGLISLEKQDYRQSLKLFELAEKMFSENSLFAEALLCRLNIGYINILSENVDYGIATTFQVLDNCLSGSKNELKSNAFLNLVKGYTIIGNNKKAEYYIVKCKEIINDQSNPLLRGELMVNMGLYYAQKGDYKLAEEFIRKGIDIFQNIGATIYMGDGLFELGNYYYSIAKYDLAKINLQKAYKIFEVSGARRLCMKSIITKL